MPNFNVLFTVARNESYTVEAATPAEAREIAHTRVKQGGPIHSIVHHRTTPIMGDDGIQPIIDQYNEYYEERQRANKPFLEFNAWRLKEGL